MTRRRWLITGGGGMLATDLREALERRGEAVIARSRAELDVTDARLVEQSVAEAKPDVIVNCAAWTRVDDAEKNEAAAAALNGGAVELLAGAANEAGAKLVQISTDFVFDGTKRIPYEPNDPTQPRSAYGRTKLLGEIAAAHAERHLILRTSWLFGVHGNNFVEAMKRQLAKGVDPLRVVADQRGRPTFTPHVADAILRLVDAGAEGIVHYADNGEATWFAFACAIVAGLGSLTGVEAIATADYPTPATRPAYSVLSTARYTELTGAEPESWREGLLDYLHTSDTPRSLPRP
jgi:dTDP-4-dehydrorhamnose reductase